LSLGGVGKQRGQRGEGGGKKKIKKKGTGKIAEAKKKQGISEKLLKWGGMPVKQA